MDKKSSFYALMSLGFKNLQSIDNLAHEDPHLQLALFKSPALDPRFVEHGAIKLSQRFPLGSKVLLVSANHRCYLGVV